MQYKPLARSVVGKWMLAHVSADGTVVAYFTGGGIARARYSTEPFDPTEGMEYDKPVYEALSSLRTAEPSWLRSAVDTNTWFFVNLGS